MSSVIVEVSGPASPDLAWERYFYPAQWSRWAPHISGVTSSTSTLQPGTHGTVTALGIIRAHFEVVSVNAPSLSWSWTVQLGFSKLVLDHYLSSQPHDHADSGTLARIELAGPWLVLVAYRPLMRMAMGRLLRPAIVPEH
ncbi:SRPBCC family protein [Corynebacterium alimapuense]|uniref:SRPBCC family protein n=1 Tax=Corynebacterium alimapuense TaxID=1576874 RepID=A0A3M8K5J1_9CORY|nr:SRPBCC family protein [Corynebacterium alimapuense]RNE48493.1 hypothetical protein C5L39_08315 [Corynebacterium alimapuense]